MSYQIGIILKSYLNGRFFQVPQGSVLGLLLYLIFIAGIPVVEDIADDTFCLLDKTLLLIILKVVSKDIYSW